MSAEQTLVDLMAALERSVREAKEARRRHRWCAKHRDGWCAVVPDAEPEEGTDGVDTVCGYVITLPGGFARRAPDCDECLAALNDPREGDEGMSDIYTPMEEA